MTAAGASAVTAIERRIETVRADSRWRVGLLAAGVVAGLGLGTVHWLGLVLGGALVALPARTVPRGIAAGAALGLLELLVFAFVLAWQGTLGPALTTGTVGLVTVTVGLAGPILGSLVRGVV